MMTYYDDNGITSKMKWGYFDEILFLGEETREPRAKESQISTFSAFKQIFDIPLLINLFISLIELMNIH